MGYFAHLSKANLLAINLLENSHKLSVNHKEGPVTHFCKVWVVGNYYNGLAIFITKVKKQVMEFLLGLGIQIAGRLVGEKNCRLVDQGTGYGNSLLLTSR